MKITAGKKIDQNDIGRLIGIVKSWYTMIQRYYQSGKKYPEAVLNDLKASISGVLKDYGQPVGASTKISQRAIKAGTFNPNWRDEYPDQIEIMIPANDDTVRDEIIDYVWSTGKFGSTGSEFGKVTIMLTDATTADDVQDLIDFVYENGATVSQYYAKRLNDRFNANFFASTRIGSRPITAAESYGWEVPDNMAQEAYDFAINSGYWDENSLNADIVNAISTDELAACLAFIFRMNDFQEWDDYLNGEEPEDDEYEDGDEDGDEDE